MFPHDFIQVMHSSLLRRNWDPKLACLTAKFLLWVDPPAGPLHALVDCVCHPPAPYVGHFDDITKTCPNWSFIPSSLALVTSPLITRLCHCLQSDPGTRSDDRFSHLIVWVSPLPRTLWASLQQRIVSSGFSQTHFLLFFLRLLKVIYPFVVDFSLLSFLWKFSTWFLSLTQIFFLPKNTEHSGFLTA